MTLVDALRTGKPVRRPIAKHKGSNKGSWLDSDFVMGLLTDRRLGGSFGSEAPYRHLVEPVDVLANDWEVKEDYDPPYRR